MIVTTIPNHPPMYVSAPVQALPSKLVRDTIYLPSKVAERLLGAVAQAKTNNSQPQPLVR
jgi:hypothetical protein